MLKVFDLTHDFGIFGFGLPAPQISNRFRSCPRSGEDLQIIFGELSETLDAMGVATLSIRKVFSVPVVCPAPILRGASYFFFFTRVHV